MSARAYCAVLVLLVASLAGCAAGPIAPEPLPANANANNCPGHFALKQAPNSWPAWSSAAGINVRDLVPNIEKPTVYDAAQALTQRIKAAGYPSPSYLGKGCFGIVVAANFEEIDKNGVRMPAPAGFPVEAPSADSAGALDFLVGLFYARPGFYRRIMFVINNAPLSSSGEAATEENVAAIVEGGSASLPPGYRNRTLTNYDRIYIYVYEFRYQKNWKAPRPIKSKDGTGMLTGWGHMLASKIFSSIPE